MTCILYDQLSTSKGSLSSLKSHRLELLENALLISSMNKKMWKYQSNCIYLYRISE